MPQAWTAWPRGDIPHGVLHSRTQAHAPIRRLPSPRRPAAPLAARPAAAAATTVAATTAAAAAAAATTAVATTAAAAPAGALAALAANASATPDQLLHLFDSTPLAELMAAAAALCDEGHGPVVTFSPKVFLPLTRLCRDACGYCTFATGPVPGRRAFMTLDEVLHVARMGVEQGCTEALFTLGDKPELRYPEAAAELAAMGHASTLDYVAAAAGAVLAATGLLPHVNAGVMGAPELRALRAVSVSQGLMLESTSQALLLPGGAHHGCPDKDPAARLATLEAAGRERVPFTTGLLVGIGESRRDRVEALLAIRESHRRHGHVQELIIQNFKAKKGTAMEHAAEPALEELLWTVAAARLLFGPAMNIQAPPNLTPEADDAAVGGGGGDGWRRLLDAGINDFGGVSPVTRDFVNPERAWPHLEQLAAATAAAGKALVPRLPVYPAYLRGVPVAATWLDGGAGRASPLSAALRHADAQGLARGSDWFAGAAESEAGGGGQGDHVAAESSGSGGSSTSGRGSDGGGARSAPLPRRRAWRVRLGRDGLLEGCARPASATADGSSPQVRRLLDAVLSPAGHELSEREMVLLFAARGADVDAVCGAADFLRRAVCGDEVAYVVNRNINYTNVCSYGCRFCAFSKGPAAEELRGAPYLLPLDEVTRRAAEAWARGATEVCMQGGIHPSFDGNDYLRILAAAKAGAPGIHVHAFSPLEVSHGAATLGWPVRRFLGTLRDAGLGSLPGTAAEVLDDAVRAELCPDKLSAAEWLEVVEAAHDGAQAAGAGPGLGPGPGPGPAA
jgi:FO synthase